MRWLKTCCATCWLMAGFGAGVLGSRGWAAQAPATRPASEDQAVIQTLLRFLDALESADAPALRQLIHTADRSRAQQLGRDALIDLIVAQRRLERAAADRFPNQARRFARNLNLIASAEDREAIAAAPVNLLEPRSARIVLPNELGPVRFQRSSPTGQWQVVLDLIESELDDSQVSSAPTPDRISLLRIEHLAALATAVGQVATRIEAGQLASAAAAETELLDRLAAARTDFRAKLDELLRRRRYGPPRLYQPVD